MPYKYRLYALGNNEHTQLGLGPTSTAIQKISYLAKVECPPPKYNQRISSIHCGANHTLLHTETSAVHGAGRNVERQLGYRVRKKNSNINSNFAIHQDCLIEFDKMYRRISFCAATERTSAYIVNPGIEGNPTDIPLLFTEGLNYNNDGELGRTDLDSTVNIRNPDTKCTFNPRLDKIPNQWFPVGIVEETTFPASKVIDLAAGMHHYVAVLDNGEVWGWGAARQQQLGPDARRTYPAGVKRPNNITPEDLGFRPRKVVCGQAFTLIAGEPATGAYTILGLDHKSVVKDRPADIKNWKDIVATWKAVIVLFQDGTVRGWGDSFKFRLIPQRIPLLEQIAAGTEHVVALTMDQRVISWGWNEHGNCGRPGTAVKYFNDAWNVITGYKGAVDLIAAGWATTFVVTRERDESSVGAFAYHVSPPAEQVTDGGEALQDEE
ncbi:RCC1/BLIP-II [Lophiostoma macrostomum CBS 122681]|uniref:RCC1/BLIP-II n=1 Tax=Lophiostoma macrostomum CBS 122681 TaxID=1314788 RepID=A0A6A6TNB9_9PLEO|nr:RCC1/BLIP-II [Lophiostoma macrostomum CBS 122681]